MPKPTTLRGEIRRLVDASDKVDIRLMGDTIYHLVDTVLRFPSTRNNFNVALTAMVKARQLNAKRASKATRRAQPEAGGYLSYGPGVEPVIEDPTKRRQPERAIGFMERRRRLDARASARRAARKAA